MPKTSASKTTSDFAPLLKGLRQIESRLESEGESRILVASEKRTEFKRQRLEAHHKILERKLLGSRVPVRGRRRVGQTRIVEARWPEDKMHEVTAPVLNFILSGQTDMRIADYSVHCRPGDVIFIPAGLPRSDGSAPDYVDITPASSCDILLFSPGLVSGIGLECSIGHSRGTKQIPGSVDERCWLKNLAISQLYTMLCEELERRGNTKSTFHVLAALLAQLQREINAGNAMVGWPFASNTAPQPGARLIGRAMKYINDHLEEHLTIDIVAHQVGVSRSVLTREFRENAKSTFTHYLIAQRMKRAEILLTEANLPVNRVSRQVGFSPERLRVLFREKHQCSPDEFRKVKN